MLGSTGCAAVMVGRAAQGNPWAIAEIMGDDDAASPTRDEVAAELLLFIEETERELGEKRASGFLKKFYAWYLGRGRFPKPFKQELVQLDSLREVERRLLAAAPGAARIVESLRGERSDESSSSFPSQPTEGDRQGSRSEPRSGRARRAPGREGPSPPPRRRYPQARGSEPRSGRARRAPGREGGTTRKLARQPEKSRHLHLAPWRWSQASAGSSPCSSPTSLAPPGSASGSEPSGSRCSSTR